MLTKVQPKCATTGALCLPLINYWTTGHLGLLWSATPALIKKCRVIISTYIMRTIAGTELFPIKPHQTVILFVWK